MNSNEPTTKGLANLSLLKWAAIVLPIAFLVSLDVLRQTVFAGQTYVFLGLPGLVFTYVFITVMVVLFSYTVFGFIARLQQQNVDQNRRLSALNEIARTAAAEPRLDDLLSASLDHILRSMGVEAGLVCLIDMEREEHSAVCDRGFPPEVVRRIQQVKLGDDPVAQEVVRTGRPVAWERVLENPRVAEAARREGILSGISAPLKSEGAVNGILVVATRKPHQFSQADQEFLEGIGGQLGMAIRNATLYQQSELQNRELSALQSVGREVTSSLKVDDLLSASLDTIIQVTAADAAEAWLLENEEELVMRCHRGADREAFLERTRFPIGEGIPGVVAQTLKPMVVHDLPSNPTFLRESVIKAGYHTFCALPLRYQDRLVGVLTVAALSPDALQSPRQLRLLEGISEWLALALENARLYQQVQNIAALQERERIAREMHDGMAQLLGYVNTQTIAVKRFLATGQTVEAQKELAKMGDIARDLYADVREGILGLRSASRSGEGLLASLKEYIEQYMDMAGVKVQVHVQEEAALARLSPTVEIQLMRIIQEALSNVRKHAKATTASITFEHMGGELRLAVVDDGQGFDLSRLPSRGWPRFGLQTMQERAESVSGGFHIESAPGKGTRVEVRIPLSS